MKVFARYFSENGLNFRVNTRVQFGTSFDVIGAAVLINPGSARPIEEVDSETLPKLKEITGKDSDWKVFSADSTMRFLEKIFNGSYVGRPKELNGVVMLFNLFNLRDQNLENALRLKDKCESKLLFSAEDDLTLIEKAPKIYLGWGEAGKSQGLLPYAEKIFERVKNSQSYYLKSNFSDNRFYHPGYVNRSYNTNRLTKEIVVNFAINI